MRIAINASGFNMYRFIVTFKYQCFQAADDGGNLVSVCAVIEDRPASDRENPRVTSFSQYPASTFRDPKSSSLMGSCIVISTWNRP